MFSLQKFIREKKQNFMQYEVIDRKAFYRWPRP